MAEGTLSTQEFSTLFGEFMIPPPPRKDRPEESSSLSACKLLREALRAAPIQLRSWARGLIAPPRFPVRTGGDMLMNEVDGGEFCVKGCVCV